MTNYFKNKKNILIGAFIIILLILIASIFWFSRQLETSVNPKINPKTFKGLIIDDLVKIPETTTINPNAGGLVDAGEYKVKLQPNSEQELVYISKAKLTLKEAYQSVIETVNIWAPDSKLVFIKSNGALGLNGKSSSWQIVFASARKGKSLEFIVEGDKIISQKEISSNLNGFDLPVNWYDSYDAIASLSNLPQFKNANLSAISFYYSVAADSWSYGLATDKNTTSMWVK